MENEVLIAVVTGLTSAIATVITLKTDIAWLKKIVDKLEKRITLLEGKPHG